VTKRYLVLVLFLFDFFGCSEPSQVTLEFRIAEDDPAPGMIAMEFGVTGERFYLHDEVLIDQSDIDSAVVITHNGRPAVELLLTSEGTRKFEELTERNVGKRCGMILNGELVSAPHIMAPIRVGRAIVAGDFTRAEARRVARGLSQP
jgi:preprotein translocase subunit SecD